MLVRSREARFFYFHIERCVIQKNLGTAGRFAHVRNRVSLTREIHLDVSPQWHSQQRRELRDSFIFRQNEKMSPYDNIDGSWDSDCLKKKTDIVVWTCYIAFKCKSVVFCVLNNVYHHILWVSVIWKIKPASILMVCDNESYCNRTATPTITNHFDYLLVNIHVTCK